MSIYLAADGCVAIENEDSVSHDLLSFTFESNAIWVVSQDGPCDNHHSVHRDDAIELAKFIMKHYGDKQ